MLQTPTDQESHTVTRVDLTQCTAGDTLSKFDHVFGQDRGALADLVPMKIKIFRQKR